MNPLNMTAAPNLTAEIMAVLMLLTVLVLCINEKHWDNLHSLPRFIAWTVLVLLVLLTDIFHWSTLHRESLSGLRKLLDAFKHFAANCTYTMFAAYFFSLVEEKRRIALWFRITCQLVPILLGILIGVSLYFGLIFNDDALGSFLPGPHYDLFLLITRLLAVTNSAIVLWFHRDLGWHDTFVLMSFGVLPTAMGFQELWHMTPSYLSLALVLFFIYLSVCRRRAELAARQQKELAEMELLLMNSRINTMVSQIQPHFIFNALTTIRYLCGDAEEARQAIADFSDYLRVNIHSLKATDPVPFQQELEHIHIYLRFEQLRFGEKLRVVYEIGPEHFSLPCLSVQPIVENAVKYGLGKKPEGGTVGLRTGETADHWLVQVWDDGVGFDPAAVTGDNHVGLANVRDRLRLMCGGSLEIQSAPGSGALVTLRIPKGSGRDDHAPDGS